MAHATRYAEVVSDDRPLIVVDAANVIGSRPDGWWRDRGAAARRLVDSLRGRFGEEQLVVVLEGKARDGLPAGSFDGIEVVHAPRDGDGSIVELVRAARGRPVTVVTADRGLRHLVHELGAATVGPGWLRPE